jgi:hypothetical protein
LPTVVLARTMGVSYQYFHDMLAGSRPSPAEVALYFKFERLNHVFAERPHTNLSGKTNPRLVRRSVTR